MRTTHRLSIEVDRAALKRWSIKLPPCPVPGSGRKPSGRSRRVVGHFPAGDRHYPLRKGNFLFQPPSLSLFTHVCSKNFLPCCHCSLSVHPSFFFEPETCMVASAPRARENWSQPHRSGWLDFAGQHPRPLKRWNERKPTA